MPRMLPPPDARNLRYAHQPAEPGVSIYVADCDVDALAREGWALLQPIEPEPEELEEHEDNDPAE